MGGLGLPFPTTGLGVNWILAVPPPLSQLNFTQLRIKNLMSFWDRFWCLLGPSWPPSWSLLGTQDGSVLAQDAPKTPLEASFFRKVDFSKKRAPRCMGARFWLQDGPQDDPRSAEDRLKAVPRRSSRAVVFQLRFVFDFDAFWAPFWVPFGIPFGAT